MSKKARERSLGENEAQAVARMLRVSPQKLNLVAGLIRGKKVDQALNVLNFTQKKGAVIVDVGAVFTIALAGPVSGADISEPADRQAFRSTSSRSGSHDRCPSIAAWQHPAARRTFAWSKRCGVSLPAGCAR